jgi:pimeloyl-ACP methyl ester carboxylesterase
MDDPATAAYRHRTDALTDDHGEGPALVCSHGTLMDRTMFRPQRALADGYRVIAYDSRARTEYFGEPYDLDDLVADCLALLDALELESPVLAGMSMGGFVGLRFALEHPDRLGGLVLIDSMAAAHGDPEREQYGGMVGRVREAGRASPELAETVSHLLFGATTHERRPELVERWTERWRTYPGEAIYREVHSWLDRPSVVDRLDEIRVPTLVVHGEEDASIDVDRGRETAEGIPDARVETVPEAGHSSNLERPEPVNAALREFLEGDVGR